MLVESERSSSQVVGPNLERREKRWDGIEVGFEELGRVDRKSFE